MAIIFAPRGALAQVLPGDEGRAGQVALAQGMANALMKAETKAKRRVTLSIAGLGWLDETELETISRRDLAAAGLPVASIHEASHLDALDAPQGLPTTGAADDPQAASETPPPTGHPPSAALTRHGQRRAAAPPEADAKAAVLRSILARVVGLYPGDKADPVVQEDRQNVLRTVFHIEVGTGAEGVAPLAALPLDLLRQGLLTLDRMQRQAPSDDAPRSGAPHPDVTATAELVASLRRRATNLKLATAFERWLGTQAVTLDSDGRPQLTAEERGQLTTAFNGFVDAAKAQRAKRTAAKA